MPAIVTIVIIVAIAMSAVPPAACAVRAACLLDPRPLRDIARAHAGVHRRWWHCAGLTLGTALARVPVGCC